MVLIFTVARLDLRLLKSVTFMQLHQISNTIDVLMGNFIRRTPYMLLV